MNDAPPSGPATGPRQALPFVAPCRKLTTDAPYRWVRAGFADWRRAPGPSLAYGAVVIAISWFVSVLALQLGSYVLLLAMLSGFVFVGPVIAIGLYAIARELGRGRQPTLVEAWRASRRALGNAMVFALALLVVCLVWVRAASAISIFLPVTTGAGPLEYLGYFGIGSLVGSLFAGIAFAAAAFALPMIADRETDSVTAVVTSINAVLRNRRTMVVWALIIVGSVVLGFTTAFIAFGLLIPVLGYATWHAYAETIDAGAWPRVD
jgi:uncharacterized membrane protein